ncbi:MAG: hypothetical protein OXC46_01200 [Thaumarchaeota archaeon]|nr:hypothetical protein [Nitrososphaerota archaeon]
MTEIGIPKEPFKRDPSKIYIDEMEDGCVSDDPHNITPKYLEHFKDVTDRLRDPKILDRVRDELQKAISGEFTYRYPITEGITLFCKELSKKEIKNLQYYFTICDTTVRDGEIAMQLEFHDFRPQPDGMKMGACKNV